MRTLLATLVIACALGGLAVAVPREEGLDAAHPVSVAGERLSPAALAYGSERAMEAAWLAGEARDRGLHVDTPAVPSARQLARLRGAVADAIAAGARSDADFVAAFDAFHSKWRARTGCLATVHDPYLDRCANRPAAASGPCHWMGEAWLCGSRGAWVVARAGGEPRTVAPRRRAAAIVRSIYARAAAPRAARARAERAARERAERLEREREQRAALAAERRAREERERERQSALAAARRRRLAEPALSSGSVTAAARACRAYDRALEPYRFGAGLQDLEGQAEGFWRARRRAIRGLEGAAADAIDRRKLEPLLRTLATGNRMLVRMARASVAGNLEVAYALLSEFDALTRHEERMAADLGLGDCLASPTAAAPAP